MEPANSELTAYQKASKAVAKYKECRALQRRMDKIKDFEIYKDTWYLLRDELKTQLNELLDLSFLSLNKDNLCHFLSMCNSHRPVDPHSILLKLSLKYEETTKCQK